MPAYTYEELEEARYELYLMGDGPAKDEAKHKALAEEALEDLQSTYGWKVLETEMYREPFTDFPVMRAVLRKDDTLKLVQWHPFNKGWFEKLSAGWGIFDPNS